MNYLLIIILLCLVLFVILRLKQGIVAPSVIWLLSFIVAFFGSFIGQFQWSFESISFDLTAELSLFILTFVVASLLTRNALSGATFSNSSNNVLTRTSRVSKIFLVFIVVLALVVAFLYLRDMQTIVGANGTILDTVEAYREYVIRLSKGVVQRSDAGISFASSFLFRALEVVASYLVICLAFLDKREYRETLKVYLPVLAVVAAVMFLCGGSRSPMIHLILCFAFAFGIRHTIEGRRISSSVVLKLLFALVLLLLGFVALSVLRGEELKLGILGYISFFFGSGVSSLNHCFDSISSLVGVPFPFEAAQSLLARFDLTDSIVNNDYWVSFEGYSSNVFTSFWSYLCYGGPILVLIYSSLFGVTATIFYVYALRAKSLLQLLPYCMFGYLIFDAIRADGFSSLVGIPLIEYIFLILILSKGVHFFSSNLKSQTIERSRLDGDCGQYRTSHFRSSINAPRP